MATPLYDEFMSTARDWSVNRNHTALPDSVIRSCAQYAADDAYQKLLIPAMEITLTVPVVIVENRSAKVSIPNDYISMIYARVPSQGDNIVFNEKVDIRTFYDDYADVNTYYFWSRLGDEFVFHGNLSQEDEIELHYYRRLPALDCLYSVNQTNIDLGRVTYTDIDPEDPDATPVNGVLSNGMDIPTEGWWIPSESPHWLRDQNRKILLFGTLKYIGSYLEDDPMMIRYEKQYIESIDSVNMEEVRRKTSGGNIQVHYNGGGLL